MKTLLKKIYFKTSSILLKLRLLRLHACMLHINYLYVSKTNIYGFFAAVFLEIIYMPFDLYNKKRLCPICQWKGYEFSPSYMGNNFRRATRCPSCLSYERHRLFYLYLIKNFIKTKGKKCLVIGIGPSKIFSDIVFPFGYKTLDLNPDFQPDYLGNLQDMPLENNSVDIIVCFRVLEHVPRPDKALREIKRILTRDGCLYLNVPIYEGLSRTYSYSENRTHCEKGPTWSYPDHCWDFEKEDLKKHITKVGMKIDEEIVGDLKLYEPRKHKTFADNDYIGEKMNLRYVEIIFRCSKT